MIHQKKSRGHRTSKIVKSRQSSGNGHLPYHLSILRVSVRSWMTWHVNTLIDLDIAFYMHLTWQFDSAHVNVTFKPGLTPYFQANGGF